MTASQIAKMAARWALAGVLLWAGVVKAVDARGFFVALLDYRLPLADGVLRFVAAVLPWLEIGCGGMLLANVWAETVRPLTVALCAAFLLATGQAWLRGLDFDCGCFGGAVSGVWSTPAFACARAAVLLTAACWIARPGRVGGE